MLGAAGELAQACGDACGEGRRVVAGVQHVGLAALALLPPHEVRAGREEGPVALAVQLQHDARHAQHHPHRDHDEV